MFGKNLQSNVKKIKSVFKEDKNLLFREITTKNRKATLVFFENLTNGELIAESIIKPLLTAEINEINDCFNTIACAEISEVESIKDVPSSLLKGAVVVMFEDCNFAVEAVVQQWDKRALMEPPTSAVLKGPREGFNESIKTNITLLRRRLNTPNLVIKSLKLGKVTNTQVSVLYLHGIADHNVARQVIKKIKSIKIDGIIDSFYVAQFLEEKQTSLFKQVGSSEKPDVVAAKMLEGRIAIVVDGSPIVLTVPFVLVEDLQSADDYYSRSFRAVVIRAIRFFGVIISVLLPGTYVAVQVYHYRVIPIKFLVTIVNSTQGLPMTPLVETIFVIILFEILYEASLRMPRYLGMALSIVGALILGDTAVKAGLISPPSVMIVALSGITFYTIPEQNIQLSILRIFFTLMGGILGFFGIITGTFFILTLLCDLNSFGAPYLAPYAPYIKDDQKDFLFKLDVTKMNTLPKSIPNEKVRRK